MSRWFLGRLESHRRSLARRIFAYTLAIALSSIALLAKREISPIFEHGRYFLHIAAVVVASLYGGLGPGIVAILVSVLGSVCFFLAARTELLAVVSHDLKNPITAILLKTQMLPKLIESGEAKLPAIRHQIELIRTSANRMKRLIEDILDMETIESGHLKLEKRDEDLHSILSSIAELFEPIAENKSIQLLIPQLSVHAIKLRRLDL